MKFLPGDERRWVELGCSDKNTTLLLPLLLGSSLIPCIDSCCCNWIALRYSSWSCCLLNATCAAITRCLSAIKLQSAQLQSLHLQNLLCPFRMETTPWFLHLAHLGSRGGVFMDARLDDVATLIVRNYWKQTWLRNNWTWAARSERLCQCFQVSNGLTII